MVPITNSPTLAARHCRRSGSGRVWAVAFVGLAVVLGLTSRAGDRSPAPGAPPESVLLEFAGSVEIARAGQPPWQPAARDVALFPGDQLRTGVDSRATVRLSDRSVIRINQSTVVEIQRPAASGGWRRFRLRAGALFFLNRERPADIEFETPIAIGAIRGTEFSLEVDGTSGATRVAMVDGRVELRTPESAVTLVGGEQALVEPNRPVRVMAALPIHGLVQWCFYYPGVVNPADLGLSPADSSTLGDSLRAYQAGDLLAARTALPEDLPITSPATRLYVAALKLAVGRVDEAESLLGEAPRDSGIADSLRGVVAAVTARDWKPIRAPATSTEWLAMSYVRQAQLDLEGAYACAARATRLAPEFGFAWARLAELEFSHGRRARATRALAEARRLAPRHAAALATAGFIALEDRRARVALECFDAAIALDGALGNAWLGRALAQAALGEIERARSDLQTAAALEPQRALFRSYLGKAWSQAGQDELAVKELRLAQRLDPEDPTAWLYSALHRSQANQINEAIRDLERSIALNDHRALFRSRLLLDQDLAVRSADLAAVYQDAGLSEVSERAATRAVEAEYATFSGHLFLARSLQAREDPDRFDLRLETARQSELLVANLLAPPGGGNLSQLLSQQQHLHFFDAPQVGIASLTEYRSRGDWLEAGSVFGQLAGLSYAVDGAYRSEGGDALNTDYERWSSSLQVRQALTPAGSVYLQVGYRADEGGDIARRYDPAEAVAGFRFEEVQEGSIYAGYHHEWSPGNHTLLLATHLPDRLTLTNPAPDVLFLRRGGSGWFNIQTDPFTSLDFASEFQLESVELQQVLESPRFAFVLGSRGQFGDVANEAILTRSLSGVLEDQSVTADLRRLSLYAYGFWRPVDSLRLTAGVTYDDLDYPRNADVAPLTPGQDSIARFSPKVGVTWELWQGGAIRGAWARSLGGLYFDQSLRLEPTQVAGFVNTFRSLAPESVVGLVPGTEFETAGFGVDQRFGLGTYVGAAMERLTSTADRTVGVLTNAGPFPVPDTAASTTESLDYEERAVSAYLSQLVGSSWVAGVRYRLSRAQLDGRFPDLPADLPGLSEVARSERSVLHQVQLTLGWNHPRGWFAQWASNWYHQSNMGYVPDRPGDQFWQHDAAVGYRFAKRHAELRLGLLNLAGQDYRLNPLNPYVEPVRQRTIVASLRLQF